MTELFQRISDWDIKFSKKIAQKTRKVLKLSSFFALSGNAQPWLIVSLLFFIFDVFMYRPDNLVQLLAAGIAAIFSTLGKYITKRKRPNEEVALKYIASGDHWSFPSGHATRMWCLAMFMMLLYPTFGWVFAIWAIAVCFGRIALEVHYFLDIIGGTVLGSIMGLIGYFLREDLYKIFIPFSNWFPTIW